MGVVTRGDLNKLIADNPGPRSAVKLADVVRADSRVAYPDEPLRIVVYRMAETGLTRFPVVDRKDQSKLLGMVSLNDLLKARVATLEAEQRRERMLRVRYLFPFRSGTPST